MPMHLLRSPNFLVFANVPHTGSALGIMNDVEKACPLSALDRIVPRHHARWYRSCLPSRAASGCDHTATCVLTAFCTGDPDGAYPIFDAT